MLAAPIAAAKDAALNDAGMDAELDELEKLMADDSGSAPAKTTVASAAPAEETKVEVVKPPPVIKKKRAAPARPRKVKPAFATFIGGATSDGFWPSSTSLDFKACVEGDDINDAKVREAVGQLSLAGGADSEAVYLTLLAVFILEEIYGDNEDEWQLIAGKAKRWLESVGVAKPANLIKKFTIALVDE